MGKKIRDLKVYLLENSILDPATGCRNWTGSTNKGYGRLKYRGKALRAARVSYAVAKNINVDDLSGDVIPSCGNSLCISDIHLFLGSCNDRRHAGAIDAARLALAAGRKKCPGCDATLTLDCFNKNSERIDGYQNYCRVCDNAQRRKWYAKPGNSGASVAYNAARRRERRDWLQAYKATLRCERCGEDHPSALDFHHREPGNKTVEISKIVRQTVSIERIKTEIAKCIVLCSNCHRKHHHEERTRPCSSGVERASV